MPLKKNKTGSNMYEWVTHMHTHLGGECSHKCTYCYVDNPIGGRNPKYSGPVRLLENELDVNYGSGKIIFIDHMNDLFAEDVSIDDITTVLAHCSKYPDNTYVFQSKNPARFFGVMDSFPPNIILGATIETNRDIEGISNAPSPYDRYVAMTNIPKTYLPHTLKGGGVIKRFLTIEPVLDFDVDIFAKWIAEINPDFLNLGADSKNHNLPEPTVEKIMKLVDKLHELGVELREKSNLERLKDK